MGSVFQRILCCSDLSERSLAAYRAAARLAAQNQAELSLLHVVPPGELVPGLDPAQARELPDPARAKLWKEHLRATHLALAPGQPCAIYLRKASPRWRYWSTSRNTPPTWWCWAPRGSRGWGWCSGLGGRAGDPPGSLLLPGGAPALAGCRRGQKDRPPRPLSCWRRRPGWRRALRRQGRAASCRRAPGQPSGPGHKAEATPSRLPGLSAG